VSTITRLFIIVNVLVFVPFGLAFLIAPVYFASTVEIQAPTTTALADLRAIYGGLSLTCGLFFLISLARPAWVLPSLWVISASSFALGLSRVYSTFASGVPGPNIFFFMTMELVGGAIGAWLYQRERRLIAAR
jgi:hypothetical protein